MNQNSNIRKIDELGRIVIPKDVRKKLHIKDNEPLEIYIQNDEIRIKKYKTSNDLIEYFRYLTDLGNRITNNKYIITNQEKIIAATNNKLSNLEISDELEMIIKNGKELKNTFRELKLTSDTIQKAYYNIIHILIDENRTGLIIEYNENQPIDNNTAIKIFKYLIEKETDNS